MELLHEAELERLLEVDRLVRVLPEVGVLLLDERGHGLDDRPLLGRHVEDPAEPRVPVEDEPGDRVVEVRVRRDREDVARHLEDALLDRLDPLVVGGAPRGVDLVVLGLDRGAHELYESFVGVHLELGRRVKELARAVRGEGRDGVGAALHLDVALRDLLRVVEGMRVEEAPDELTRDALEDELEGRVLDRRVVAGLVGRGPDLVAEVARAVVLRDFLGVDDLGAVAGACGRDRVVVRVLEPVLELDDRSRLDAMACRRGARSHQAILQPFF